MHGLSVTCDEENVARDNPTIVAGIEEGRAEDLTGDPIYDAPALLRAPTVYDLAHAAGRRTAAIDWPALD